MLQETNIAWSTDRTDGLYGTYQPTNFNSIPDYRGGSTIIGNVNEDPHFLVWMRPGAARTVRKLYAVIREDIPAGLLSMQCFNASQRQYLQSTFATLYSVLMFVPLLCCMYCCSPTLCYVLVYTAAYLLYHQDFCSTAVSPKPYHCCITECDQASGTKCRG